MTIRTKEQRQEEWKRYYAKNKERIQKRNKDWAAANPEYVRKQARKDMKKRYDLIVRDKIKTRRAHIVEQRGGACDHCKNIYPACVFDFHHLDPATKDRPVSTMMSYSEERLQAELAKCIMLCANCHRIHHHGQSTP